MEEMNARGLRYVFQYSVPGGFHVDFAFPEKMVAIECDGDYWHAHPKKYSRRKLDRIQKRNVKVDKERAELITSAGWKIIRFWEEQIEKDVKKCVNLIESKLKASKIKPIDDIFL
jgi:very-short-patch-repair endonuclease